MTVAFVVSPARLVLTIAGVALTAACGGGSRPSTSPSACPGSDALWVASDYTSSSVGALSSSGAVWATTGRVNLGADPALSVSRGRAFYVARDEDTIFEIGASCGNPTEQWNVHQASSPSSSDPQDVAVASDGSLWIPLYLVPTLLVISPSGAVAHTLDLSSYDSDGNPDASAIAIVDTPAGEKAFVPLQRLTWSGQSYQAEQPSWMLRVDVATATVEAEIVLAGRNPFGMVQDGSILWLSEPGESADGGFASTTDALGGIERFDTSTSTTALIAHEADLGGSVVEVAVSGSCGAAIVADATLVNATSLVTFDPVSGAPIAAASQSPLATVGADGGFYLQGSLWLNGDLYIGDRRRATDGYPVHALSSTAACALEIQPDAIFLPQPPVAVRAPD
ncbi:MAG: hypothetical protein ABSF69_24695 [Polyangiaceae bacterium]|jgi:hypothetical protein